ncbi:hypothetical protein L0F63_003912 [Massospora cicadina]|nr:hypothetical protein L0F63_003912 [Massospora cicadina]
MVSAFQLKCNKSSILNDSSQGKPLVKSPSLRKQNDASRKSRIKKELPVQEKNPSLTALDNKSQCDLLDCDRTIYPYSTFLDRSISIDNVLGYLSSDYLSDGDEGIIFDEVDIKSVWSLATSQFENTEKGNVREQEMDKDDPFGFLATEREVHKLSKEGATLESLDSSDTKHLTKPYALRSRSRNTQT